MIFNIQFSKSVRLNTFKVFGVFLIVSLVGCKQKLPKELEEIANSLPEKIDYSIHVKPILSDRCFACHGPDNNTRKADLRFDTKEGIYAALKESDGKAFVPKNLKKSIAFQRMMTHNEDYIMPPPESNLILTDYEKAVIAKWINQGAEWKPHWSFIKPEKADLPEIQNFEWATNEIDFFIADKVTREGLENSEKADKETIIRRLSFDLRGLPPTLEEIDAFLSDNSENSYEKRVDEFLKSTDAAERLTLEWLDVARYADSHGLHSDGPRTMWPWRDWIIKAFKQNMPFDQFIKWQIAGDMLPDATKEQILATAFNRNHPMSAEGGIIDEEFRMSYVMDRVVTTSRTFLGLTLECAQCHDHKYDPLSQKEFYEFAAFYNNMNELGMIGDNGNFGPELPLTNAETDSLLSYIENLIDIKERKIADKRDKIEKTISNDINLENIQVRKPIGYFPLDAGKKVQEKNKTRFYYSNQNNQLKNAEAPQSLKTTAGIKGNSLQFGGDEDYLNIHNLADFEKNESFSISLWAKPQKKDQFQGLFSNTGTKNQNWRGYEIILDSLNYLMVRLTNTLPTNCIELLSKEPIPMNEWSHITMTYNGSGKANGVKLYINAKEIELNVHVDNLFRSILANNRTNQEKDFRPLTIGKTQRQFNGDKGLFNGLIDELEIYNVTLSPVEVAKIYSQFNNTGTLTFSKEQIAQHYLLTKDTGYIRLHNELTEIHKKEQSIYDTVVDVMVMQEENIPRPTFVLDRGSYDSPTERVYPAIPQVLGTFPEDLPKNRIGLADWLTSEDNPLTARVIVNRYWQMIFGTGIVKTAGDFGSQGELPTHPELLDWLAVDFMESGWDIRHLLKKMVMSSTYRQTTFTNNKTFEKDPQNQLLARGPKGRLAAEMIRDNALASSGLLVRKVGGPSVKPYQPEGLWEITSFSDLDNYVMDSGDDLYRKSMYTFVRRTVPPPNMNVFDAPNRSFCVVRRQKTITPLQALVLMNDPQFVEMCRAMADRIQQEGGNFASEQISYGFRLLTGRKPQNEEKEILLNLYNEELEQFTKSPKKCSELKEIGSYNQQFNKNAPKTAALTMVCNVMMSHDETFIIQ